MLSVLSRLFEWVKSEREGRRRKGTGTGTGKGGEVFKVLMLKGLEKGLREGLRDWKGEAVDRVGLGDEMDAGDEVDWKDWLVDTVFVMERSGRSVERLWDWDLVTDVEIAEDRQVRRLRCEIVANEELMGTGRRGRMGREGRMGRMGMGME